MAFIEFFNWCVCNKFSLKNFYHPINTQEISTLKHYELSSYPRQIELRWSNGHITITYVTFGPRGSYRQDPVFVEDEISLNEAIKEIEIFNRLKDKN